LRPGEEVVLQPYSAGRKPYLSSPKRLNTGRSRGGDRRGDSIGLSFPGVDAAGTIDPLRIVDGVEPGIELGITPPLDPDEESMLILCDRLDVLIGDHAPVADEDDPTELEAFA
jgi:hypothetical protein